MQSRRSGSDYLPTVCKIPRTCQAFNTTTKLLEDDTVTGESGNTAVTTVITAETGKNSR